jgi:hypothetical protein
MDSVVVYLSRKAIRRNKSENGYSLRTRTLCINQLDDDFPGDAPSVSWCFWGVRSNRGWTLLSFARYRCSFGLSDVSPAVLVKSCGTFKAIRRNKSENGYSLRTRTLCINQLDDDFPGDAL